MASYRKCARARAPINPRLAQGDWAFSTASLGYQLRAYLWHYFVSFDRAVAQQFADRNISVADWSWTKIFELLIRDFSLSVVTFNYDLIADNLLRAITGRRVCEFVEAPNPPLNHWPMSSLFLLHIHGGIHQYLVFPATYQQSGPNPWLPKVAGSLVVQGDVSTGSRTAFGLPLRPPYDFFPLTPSLVPPGHQGDDICNPWSRVTELSRELLASAQLVIFCGLSAREPDTDEIASLVNAIRPGALIVWVGRAANADDQNDLARLIRESKAGARHFVDANDLPAIRTHLTAGGFRLNEELWNLRFPNREGCG